MRTDAGQLLTSPRTEQGEQTLRWNGMQGKWLEEQ